MLMILLPSPRLVARSPDYGLVGDGSDEAADESPIDASQVWLGHDINACVNEGAQHSVQPQCARLRYLECARRHPSRHHSDAGQEQRADEPQHHKRGRVEVHLLLLPLQTCQLETSLTPATLA